ncbi:MAG: hypothetical protein M3503_02435 [Actinomycetota bacterium]|nr:hypothetical protein [Actinomycetota bacterium]
MPWCDDCSRFWSPPAMGAGGTCPTCGRTIADPSAAVEDQKAPWHFKLLIGAVVGYLGWRGVQGVQWLVELL